ncbi:MAG: CBS domain-containing protein [Nitriliruptoraceae bacterium]
MAVPVSTVLQRKGHEVATIVSDASVQDALLKLAEHGVGALVVSPDGRSIEGVLSERDIVRRLAAAGAATLEEPVEALMTRNITVCERSTTTDELVVMMTEGRIRHVPVVDDGVLSGIVSIGDIVKWRMEELAEDAKHLESYVSGSY